jgi:hypothetical protein
LDESNFISIPKLQCVINAFLGCSNHSSVRKHWISCRETTLQRPKKAD